MKNEVFKIGIVVGEFDPITQNQVKWISDEIREGRLTAAWVLAVPFGHESLEHRERLIEIALHDYPHIALLRNSDKVDCERDIKDFIRKRQKTNNCQIQYIYEGGTLNGSLPFVVRMELRNQSGDSMSSEMIDYIKTNNLYGYTGKEKNC